LSQSEGKASLNVEPETGNALPTCLSKATAGECVYTWTNLKGQNQKFVNVSEVLTSFLVFHANSKPI